MSIHHRRFAVFIKEYNNTAKVKINIGKKYIYSKNLTQLRELMILTSLKVVDFYGTRWFYKLDLLIKLFDQEITPMKMLTYI